MESTERGTMAKAVVSVSKENVTLTIEFPLGEQGVLDALAIGKSLVGSDNLTIKSEEG